jgi:hypothetical protein
MQRLAAKLTNVEPDVREGFASVSAGVQARMTGRASPATSLK